MITKNLSPKKWKSNW